MGRPKAKAAPRAGKAGVKRKVDDVAESAGCVAKLEHAISKASEVKTPSGRKRSRTESQVIAKIIVDHFHGFSDEELYVIVKSGCTCVGQITHDRERISNGEQVSMGKYYYIGLRATYQSPHSVVAKLIVKKKTRETPRMATFSRLSRICARSGAATRFSSCGVSVSRR